MGVKLLRAAVSIVFPNETIIPRHGSPQQGRLRMHCPLFVPEGAQAVLHVGKHLASFQEELSRIPEGKGIPFREGECFWFDESFDHTVFYTGVAPRVTFVMDVFHPGFYAQARGVSLEPLPFSRLAFGRALRRRKERRT